MPACPSLGLSTSASIFRAEYVRLFVMIYNIRKRSGTFVDTGGPVV
jgi:hypothetical protein